MLTNAPGRDGQFEQPLICPGCGDDLRGRPAGACPRCGIWVPELLDEDEDETAAVPAASLTCPTCGYCLGDLPHYTCPECGADLLRQLERPASWLALRRERLARGAPWFWVAWWGLRIAAVPLALAALHYALWMGSQAEMVARTFRWPLDSGYLWSYWVTTAPAGAAAAMALLLQGLARSWRANLVRGLLAVILGILHLLALRGAVREWDVYHALGHAYYGRCGGWTPPVEPVFGCLIGLALTCAVACCLARPEPWRWYRDELRRGARTFWRWLRPRDGPPPPHWAGWVFTAAGALLATAAVVVTAMDLGGGVDAGWGLALAGLAFALLQLVLGVMVLGGTGPR